MSFRIWGSATDSNQERPIVSCDDYFELPGLFKESVSSVARNVKLHADIPPLDFFRIGIPIVVSRRLMKVIQGYCRTAEFLPVTVEIEGKDESSDPFYLANIMDHVDCLDEIHGQYTYWRDGTVDEIKSLALNESKMEGHHLFWVDRTPPILLCASQAVQDAVRAGHFTGIGFRDPARWKIMSEWH